MKLVSIFILLLCFSNIHCQVFKSIQKSNIPHDDGTSFIEMGDIDNDNDFDIVTMSVSGDVYWYRNYDGQGSFNVAQKINVTATGIGIGDIDNDYDNDILITSEYFNSRILSWARNSDGAGTFINASPIYF